MLFLVQHGEEYSFGSFVNSGALTFPWACHVEQGWGVQGEPILDFLACFFFGELSKVYHEEGLMVLLGFFKGIGGAPGRLAFCEYDRAIGVCHIPFRSYL